VVGPACEPSALGVDHHQPRAAPEGGDRRGGVRQPGHRRVVAPVEDDAGVVEVRHVDARYRRAVGVDRGEVAPPAAQLHVGHVVGAAERAPQPHDPVDGVADRGARRRTVAEHDRLGAVPGPQRQQPLGHGVERLVPADLLPAGVGGALPVRTPEWHEEPVGMLDQLGSGLALRAHRPTGRMCRERLQGREPPVGDLRRRPAPRHAERTPRLHFTERLVHRHGVPRLGRPTRRKQSYATTSPATTPRRTSTTSRRRAR
jgi:hypothetical protein